MTLLKKVFAVGWWDEHAKNPAFVETHSSISGWFELDVGHYPKPSPKSRGFSEASGKDIALLPRGSFFSEALCILIAVRSTFAANGATI